MEQKKIDCIIPVWNARRYAEATINALREKTTDMNIIVVNNGSDKETTDWLNECAMNYENFHVIHNDKNEGYVPAMNAGVKFSREMTKSPFIAMATSDVIVSTGWFESMTKHFEDPMVALVGPVSNNVAGRQNVVYSNTKYSHEEVDFLIGLFYIIRADVVDQLVTLDGFLFDEIFNMGSSDDLDISIRIRKLGYKLIIDRLCYVHHFLSQSLSKLAEQQGTSLNSLHGKFYDIFVQKHGITSKSQREPYLYIGVPSVSEKVDYRFWLSTVTQNLNFKHSWAEPIIREIPDMARNKLAQQAMDCGCTHLLVLDDDMIYDDQNIIMKLIKHAEEGADIVGVRAYTRKPPHTPCVFYQTETGFYKEVDFDSCGLREVDGIGMGATLINLDVFRKMEYPWFEFHKVNVLGSGNERFGEDLYFCKKAKELGFKVWCDTDIEVYHVGDNKIVSRKSYHEATKRK
jgi:glycosyltransferase involved in cell wall biosynthesis